VNKEIKKAIIEGRPEIFGKIGGIEASHVYQYLISGQPKLVRGNTLFVNAGVYCDNEDSLLDWLNHYMDAIRSMDYVLEWCPEQGDQYVLDKIWGGGGKFFEFVGIEPFNLGEDGWHYSLKDKRVLCISPFSETVKSQASVFDKIWPGAEIGEIITITSDYPEVLTGGDPRPWKVKYDELVGKIQGLDGKFDLATIGCGGFSLPLCKVIKDIGKPSIHLGGGNQLLYGISGKRWDDSFQNKTWYNTSYWVKPKKEEIPVNKNLVENGCYW